MDSSMTALASVDLRPGDMAVLSGGAVYIYGPTTPMHRSDPGEHWSDCAANSEPAFLAGPCNCGGLS